MIALAALALMQAAPATAERWSILAGPCPKPREGEVVVCGDAAAGAPRLPLPDEREVPRHARRPTGDPRAALDNAGPPCPPRGCPGPGLNLIEVGAKAVDAIGYALKRRHPGKREPIALD